MFTTMTTRLFDRKSAHGALVTVRAASLEDTETLARLSVEQYGGSLARYDVNLTHELLEAEDDPEQLILTACVHGEVVGYARALYHRPPPEWRQRRDVAPQGWYLTGVLVDPVMRRMGVGALLTQARLEHIFTRADEVLYFTHQENVGSIELHRQMGFQERGRGLRFAGAQLTTRHIIFHLPVSGWRRSQAMTLHA